MSHILSCVDSTSQSSEEKTYETFTEEELREAKEAWDDWEPMVDKRISFIERYHKKGEVFFVGLKSHKYGKDFSKIVRFRKSLLDNQYYFTDNSWGAVTHATLGTYQWKSISHAEEWLHKIDAFPVDIDTGTTTEEKMLAFDSVMYLHNNYGVEVDYINETNRGLHAIYKLLSPIYAYKDKDHIKSNTKQLSLLRDFKRYIVDVLEGDKSQPGMTMLAATPYLYDPMYIGNGKGISIGKLIPLVKELSKKRHPICERKKKKEEEYVVSRNCKAFTISLLCYANSRDQIWARELVEAQCPTLPSAEISTIIKSAFKGKYNNATNEACKAYGLGRNNRDAARNLGIIPSLSREEIRDIRAKHYKAINETKKLETSVKIGKAVEMILNDGLVPSIRLISRYSSLGTNTVIRHNGISW